MTFGGLALTGTGNGDYTLTASTQAATITAKALTYSGLSVPSSKVYDGTTTAVVSGDGRVADGGVGGQRYHRATANPTAGTRSA